MNKAVFLDRDGTINYDTGYTHKIEDYRLIPKTIEALKLLKDSFLLFIISNQSGIGKGYYTIGDAGKFNGLMLEEFKKEGISLKKIYICPHTSEQMCDCRKPSRKFISEAQKEFGIDLANSWVVGDHPCDVEMGMKAGCKTIYLLTGHGEKHRNELDKNNLTPGFIAENLFEAAKIINESK